MSISNAGTDRVAEFVQQLQAVKTWIETVLNVQLGSSSSQSAQLDEFEKSLQNGVILCYLMLEIEPNSIPRIQENTDQVFKLKENVKFFIDACLDYGVPRHRIFQVNDLWDRKSVVNVVYCLFALAITASKKGFGIRIKEPVPPYPTPTLNQTQINTLKEQLARVKENPTGKARPKISPMIFRTKLSLLVGSKDLDKVENGFTKLQAMVRGNISREVFRKRVRDEAYRDNVAKEILETEKDYVSNLGVCITAFLTPMKTNTKKLSLTNEDVTCVFGNIETLHSVNTKLLHDLEPRIQNWGPSQLLGDIFGQIVSFLPVYTEYVQNFNNSLQICEKLAKSNSSFTKFLEEQKGTPEAARRDIHCFLIMPIQRIPRYNLLLNELVKRTDKEHPDYNNLTSAISQVKKLAENLNEKKREMENKTKIYEIESLLVGFKAVKLSDPGRMFILEGTLLDDKKNEIAIYLFNDYLILGKRDKKVLTAKNKENMMNISKIPVKYKEHYSTAEIDFQPNDGKKHHVGFDILKGGKSVALLLCQNDIERDKWMKSFKSIKGGATTQPLTHLPTPMPSASPSSSKSNVNTPPPTQPPPTPPAKSVEQQLMERRARSKTFSPAAETTSSAPRKSLPVTPPHSASTNNVKESKTTDNIQPAVNNNSPVNEKKMSRKSSFFGSSDKRESKTASKQPDSIFVISEPTLKTPDPELIAKLPNDLPSLNETRKFILAQLKDVEDQFGNKKKSKYLTQGKKAFAAQIAIKLNEHLDLVEQKIKELETPQQEAPKNKVPISTSTTPRPLPTGKKPKDMFGSVKIKRQLAKPLPPPPKPLVSQIETSVTNEWQDEGQRYYWNTVTQETSWTLPTQNPVADAEKIKAAWEECQTETGDKYYYNSITGESTWQNPFFEIEYKQSAKKGNIKSLWLNKK